jgi:hypothetical protein
MNELTNHLLIPQQVSRQRGSDADAAAFMTVSLATHQA